jgi:hypothetical protein
MNKVRIISIYTHDQIGDIDYFADFWLRTVDLSDWYDMRIGEQAYGNN